jgi:hypothetical protein
MRKLSASDGKGHAECHPDAFVIYFCALISYNMLLLDNMFWFRQNGAFM